MQLNSQEQFVVLALKASSSAIALAQRWAILDLEGDSPAWFSTILALPTTDYLDHMCLVNHTVSRKIPSMMMMEWESQSLSPADSLSTPDPDNQCVGIVGKQAGQRLVRTEIVRL